MTESKRAAALKDEDWKKLSVGVWFFHDSPGCVERYSVQERTSDGCSIVCSTPYHHESAMRAMKRIAELHNAEDGWKREAQQLRKNYTEHSECLVAFVGLLEKTLPPVKIGKATEGLPLALLAMHHLAMMFHTHAGPKASKIMMAAEVEDLPKAFGDFRLNKNDIDLVRGSRKIALESMLSHRLRGGSKPSKNAPQPDPRLIP